MRPRFLVELARPENRPRLWLGVWCGYAMTVMFGVLLLMAHLMGALVSPGPLYALVGLKLLTNTVAWWSLHRNVGAATFGALNVFTDIAVMTGGIYFTGGPVSPLFSVYVIEVAVLSVLTNLSTTVVTVGIGLAMYAAMSWGIHMGILERFSAPHEITGTGSGFAVFNFLFGAFVLGVTGAFMTVTLRMLRQKEKALERRTRQLVEAGKQKAQFMANITHELRTPIHGICGLSDVLNSGVYGQMTAKQLQAQERIKQSAKGLLSLVDNLLRLSQADAGKLTYRASKVDLGTMLPHVLASASWMVGMKKVSLASDISEDLPIVWTDRGKLTHVVLNLLSNAVKFTPADGSVTLGARATEDGVVIWVRDTGVGIPPSEREKIFEAFQQVDGSDEREWGGMGLGLNLVRHLTNLLGGRVTVQTSPSAGSTFSVHLFRELVDRAVENMEHSQESLVDVVSHRDSDWTPG